ncbi:hypothetical protein BH24DEI2_BH24DEI2_29150 [soil metagenome]
MKTTSGRDAHRAAGPDVVTVAVVTISDTRTLQTDSSGDYLEAALAEAGHTLSERALVKDDKTQIRETLERLLKSEAQVVLTSGGTGIAGRDFTVPIVESLIIKPMPGFGELFRMLSYEEVGPAAMLSRALGGLAEGGLLFALPGSSNAVKTAWEKLLKKELSHLVFEFERHG